MSTYSSDRPPLTLTAISPLLLSYYAQTVLAILPNTFIFKLLLLPFILLQIWRCTVRFDYAVLLAQLLGQSPDRIAFWNFLFACAMFGIALRSFEWTFIKRPLRRYELPKRAQDAPVERHLSPSNVLFDSFDLMCNTRGVGWSWSTNPTSHENSDRPSIAFVLAKTLLKLTVFDTSQYIIQYVCPSVNNPKGGSIFDPSLSLVPRIALAAFATICSGMWTSTLVDSIYHISSLVGRAIFRQPAALWPRAFHRPWMSTSIHEFWGFRWHQFMRHQFIVFGARPGGVLFGKPGAFIGGFAVSAILHHIGLWGTGNGTEFLTTGGFFVLMGVGAVMEGAFKRTTGLRVQGWVGWSWTMLWTTTWGMFMVDGWARHGMLANEFFPNQIRPGRMVVDTVIALSSK